MTRAIVVAGMLSGLLVVVGCGTEGENKTTVPDAAVQTDVETADSERDARADAGRDAPDTTAGDIRPADVDIDLGPQLDLAKLSPSCFTGGETPQLDLSGPVTNWTWNDPHVLRVGGEYWMYASATDFFQFPVRLYRLVSDDGENWNQSPATPILDVAAAGAWDAGGVETPAVVRFKNQYHLFYTGYERVIGDPEHTVFEFRIGHAVSDDGVTFSRPTANPVVAPSPSDADASNDWYGLIVGEPGPVVRDDTLYLYFTAVGVDATLGKTLQVIGVTTTTDGVVWTSPELALAPDQTIYPRGDDWIGYSTPNAIVLGGQTHLFFDVAHQPEGGAWLQQRLHHAVSPNGLDGWVHDADPIHTAGKFDWAVGEVRSPHALLDETTLRLYFAGHELDGTPPDHFAIGMSTCDLAR